MSVLQLAMRSSGGCYGHGVVQVPLKDNTKKIGPTGKMNITWTGRYCTTGNQPSRWQLHLTCLTTWRAQVSSLWVHGEEELQACESSWLPAMPPAAGTHGVYQIPSGSCPSTFSPGNGQTELIKPQDGDNYVWQPPADAKAGNKVKRGSSLRGLARTCLHTAVLAVAVQV